jgi:hypothetical protein
LVSSGILRKLFGNPSEAPEELPKDVQRISEADSKAEGIRRKEEGIRFQIKWLLSGKK